MVDVIDIHTRKKAEPAPENKTIKELIESIAKHESIGKMDSAIVLLLGDEEGRLWVHNMSDEQLLWQAEMLRLRALSNEEA